MSSPIHPGAGDGRSPWEKKKGPEGVGQPKDDGIPRDAAGETYMDRVRNINTQLQAMEPIFLDVLAEHQRAQQPPTDVSDEGIAEDLAVVTEEDLVNGNLRVTKEELEMAREAYFRWSSMGAYAANSVHFLIRGVVEPILKQHMIEAREKGWFGPDGQD